MHQFLWSHQFQTEALHLDQEHLHLVSHILKSNGPNSESSKLGIKIGSREMVFEVPIGTKLQFLKIRSLKIPNSQFLKPNGPNSESSILNHWF